MAIAKTFVVGCFKKSSLNLLNKKLFNFNHIKNMDEVFVNKLHVNFL